MCSNQWFDYTWHVDYSGLTTTTTRLSFSLSFFCKFQREIHSLLYFSCFSSPIYMYMYMRCIENIILPFWKFIFKWPRARAHLIAVPCLCTPLYLSLFILIGSWLVSLSEARERERAELIWKGKQAWGADVGHRSVSKLLAACCSWESLSTTKERAKAKSNFSFEWTFNL